MGAVFQRFFWDLSVMRYRYPNGSIVSTAKVKDALDKALAKRAQHIYQQSVLLKEGQVTLAAWQQTMKAAIKDSQIYSAAMAVGGLAHLKGSDYGLLGPLSKHQYNYLAKFAKGIESGKVPLDGVFLRRSELYVNAGWQTYTIFEKKLHLEQGYDEEKNILEASAEHCSECVFLAALDWQPIGTIKAIGTRKCRSRDRCHFQYRISPAKKKALKAAEKAKGKIDVASIAAPDAPMVQVPMPLSPNIEIPPPSVKPIQMDWGMSFEEEEIFGAPTPAFQKLTMLEEVELFETSLANAKAHGFSGVGAFKQALGEAVDKISAQGLSIVPGTTETQILEAAGDLGAGLANGYVMDSGLLDLVNAKKIVNLSDEVAGALVPDAVLLEPLGVEAVGSSFSDVYPIVTTPPSMPAGFAVVGEATEKGILLMGKPKQVQAFMVKMPDGNIAWVNKTGKGIDFSNGAKLKKAGYAIANPKAIEAAAKQAVAVEANLVPQMTVNPTFPDSPPMPSGFSVTGGSFGNGWKVTTPSGKITTVNNFGIPVEQFDNSVLLSEGYFPEKKAAGVYNTIEEMQAALPPFSPSASSLIKVLEKLPNGQFAVEITTATTKTTAYLTDFGAPASTASAAKLQNLAGYFGPPTASLPKMPTGFKIMGSYDVPITGIATKNPQTLLVYKVETPQGLFAYVTEKGKAYNAFSETVLKNAGYDKNVAQKVTPADLGIKPTITKPPKSQKIRPPTPRGEDEVLDRYRDNVATMDEQSFEALRQGVLKHTLAGGYDSAVSRMIRIKKEAFRETFRKVMPEVTDEQFERAMQKYASHVSDWRGSSNASLAGDLKRSAERISNVRTTFHNRYFDHDPAKRKQHFDDDPEVLGIMSGGSRLPHRVLDLILAEERRFNAAMFERVYGGRTTMTVYRGVQQSYFDDIGVTGPKLGEERSGRVAMNSIASWSRSKAKARGFGPYVFEIEVEFEDVTFNGWSSSLINTEWEMVVLGHNTDYKLTYTRSY